MNDSNIEGLYFSNWENDTNQINDNDYEFSLQNDMYIYAYFSALYYNVTFNYLNDDNTQSEYITSGAKLTVDGVTAKYWTIGSKIEIVITEQSGYKLTGAYYVKGTVETSIFDILTSDNISFYYTIERFLPSDYLSTSRDEQITSDGAKNLVINLNFVEKVYCISTVVSNQTKNGTKYLNTTGIEDVNNWIDRSKLSVQYLYNSEYVTKAAGFNCSFYVISPC